MNVVLFIMQSFFLNNTNNVVPIIAIAIPMKLYIILSPVLTIKLLFLSILSNIVIKLMSLSIS